MSSYKTESLQDERLQQSIKKLQEKGRIEKERQENIEADQQFLPVINRSNGKINIHFSNIESRLVFNYIIGYTMLKGKKKVEMNLELYYGTYRQYNEEYVHLKTKYTKEDETLCDKMENILSGDDFIHRNLNDYKIGQFNTYLVYDGEHYKIGKATDVKKRVSDLRVANPSCQLISSSSFIPEKFMHEVFDQFNVAGEWFDLDDKNLLLAKKLLSIESRGEANVTMRFILARMKSHRRPDIYNILSDNYMKYIIPFGKYKGRLLHSMLLIEELSYLEWLYKSFKQQGKTDEKIYIMIIQHFDMRGKPAKKQSPFIGDNFYL